MQQRVRLANLVSFYRANRPWMDGLAFSARPQRWSDYNAFVSANFESNRVALTKTEAANGTCIVASYRISEGNLPTISVNRVASGKYSTNLYVGDVNPATATVAEVTTALLANNNGMWEGMQLSLIVNYQQQVGGVYRAIVRYYEVILSLSDTRLFHSLMSDEHIAAVDNSIGFTAGAADPVLGFAFILSADEAGKTRTSTQELILTDDSLYTTYTTESALANAIASYGGGQINAFLSAGYQGSSTGSVTIPLSILSVNGKNAGEYLGSGTANNETLAARLTRVIPTGVETTAAVEVKGSTGQLACEVTSVEDRTVNLNTNSIGSANDGIITKVILTIGGTAYTIEFADSEGDITGGGDVTE